MRHARLYLADVVDAGDSIARFLAGVSEDAFLASDLIRSAVLQKLMIIGEAAARIPEEVRRRRPEVPWADIADFRNVAARGYFTMDWSIVWTIASEQVPELRRQVAAILDREPPP